MKKYFIFILLLLITGNLSLLAQQRNFNQFIIGLSYGFPSGTNTKLLNENLYKFNLGQEFALNKFISLDILSDFASTKGKSLNPDINKVGLGGGFKIQLIPIIEAILKKDSISNYNYFLMGNGFLNLNNISNYAKPGQMSDINVIIGFEFINKNYRVFKLFYGANYFYNNSSLSINSNDVRSFNQFGIALGFKNFSKLKK